MSIFECSPTARIERLSVTALARRAAMLLASSVCLSAQAVHLSENGIGQALLYPYYTARGGTVSVITVVNHTDRAKALKVRFIEGKASKEVLDFNLYLSAHDQWAVAIGAATSGVGAIIKTLDRSCTTPPIPVEGQAFVDYAYRSDPIAGTLDRTMEGYAEIIEMADILPGSPSEAAITHRAGIPNDCTSLRSDTLPRDIIVGSGGLSGQGYLITPNSGTSYGYAATALENFAKNQPVWFEPGSIDPNLTHVNPKISLVFDRRLGLVMTDWSTGSASVPVDPVSAVLSRGYVQNTYTTNPNIGGTSSWVVTMPTKSYYFRGTNQVRLFPSDLTAAGSCHTANLEGWDAEAGIVTTSLRGGGAPNQMCWESSVINFGTGGATIASSNAYRAGTLPGADGNARLSFGTALLSTKGAVTTIISPNATVKVRTDVAYVGLPVIGFQLTSMSGANKQYPALYPHRGEVDIR